MSKIPILDYGRHSPRHRRVVRAALAIAAVAVIAQAVRYCPRAWQWCKFTYDVHECRVYQPPTGDIWWDLAHGWHYGGADAARGLLPAPAPYPPAWARLQPYFQPPPRSWGGTLGGTLFVGELTSPGGHIRLVGIEFDGSNYAPLNKGVAETRGAFEAADAFVLDPESSGTTIGRHYAQWIVESDIDNNWGLFESSAEFKPGKVSAAGQAVIPFRIDGRDLTLIAELEDNDDVDFVTPDAAILRQIGHKLWPKEWYVQDAP
jgi:hypothetical protein